jgi:hypothetical protein
MSQSSDFGRDQLALAGESTTKFEDEAKARGTAPREYQVIVRKDGVDRVVTFTADKHTRDTEMRRHGIHPDNDKWTLRSRDAHGTWGEPIGAEELKSAIKKLR